MKLLKQELQDLKEKSFYINNSNSHINSNGNSLSNTNSHFNNFNGSEFNELNKINKELEEEIN